MNKVIEKSILFLGLMMLVTLGYAQPPGEDDPKREERIERLKRVYFTEKLDLSVEDAEKFWPVYNEYSKKRKEVRKSIRKSHDRFEVDALSEKEFLSIHAEITASRHKEVDTDGDFLIQVLPILGPAKTARLVKLEQEFRKELMDRMKERREDGPPPGRR